jgi:hypothetical protein
MMPSRSGYHKVETVVNVRLEIPVEALKRHSVATRKGRSTIEILQEVEERVKMSTGGSTTSKTPVVG